MEVLGIDVGGSGIKGGLVDTVSGNLIGERIRIPTPEGAKPSEMAAVIKQIVDEFRWKGPVGVGFPSLIYKGIALTAANIDAGWIGTNVAELITSVTGLPAYVLNDADAAGLAEMKFGAGKDHKKGVVAIFTFGTGIGSAYFIDGHLFPNTELGHLEIRGKDAEDRASAGVKTVKELSYEKWAERVQEFLGRIEALLPPDLIIIGGGVSKDSEKFFKFLTLRAEVVPAQFRNRAGIIGAALYAAAGGSTSEY